MSLSRQSGILLHPTSLPGPHGSGDLGPAAYYFVDWLVAARQTLWQILPLGGIGPGNSPYMSPSAFAGNELLIDLAQLMEAGWLDQAEIAPDPRFEDRRVNFTVAQPFRMSRLRLAARRFFADLHLEGHQAFSAFCSKAGSWLNDYALFMALDKEFGGNGKVWQDWPAPLVRRTPKALRDAEKTLVDECNFWKFCQWRFHDQWTALQNYAHSRGIEIVGDIPIFVSAHSADVWANQKLFDLDDHRRPRVVAGVPPDYFSATGQLWGNPLYDWAEHEKENYRWWVERMRRMHELCDIVRIDHFRGFETYWEIPATAQTAINGCWKKGPGSALFAALGKTIETKRQSHQARLRFIAEDLGIITHEVTVLRETLGLPGMRILQFAFDGHTNNHYLPHNFEPDTVVYTGTHDNDTCCGWWDSLAGHEQDFVRRYLGISGEQIQWDLIRTSSASIAAVSIIPMQDVLGLGSESRMNQPGVADGSWEWRFGWDQVASWHAERLGDLTWLHGRIPQQRPPTHSSSTGRN